MRLTCKVHEPNSPTEVLGAIIAQDHAATEAHFLEASAKAAHTHSAIRLVEDTACELVLTRRCADVCKVTHSQSAPKKVASDCVVLPIWPCLHS